MRRRRRIPPKVWLLILVLAGMGVGLWYLWSAVLFQQLDVISSQRLTHKPTQYFSAIPTLRSGDAMTMDALRGRLENRGYREDDNASLEPGEFSRPALDTLTVNFQLFHFPDGHTLEGPHSFVFSGQKLARIERNTDSARLDSLEMEPLSLGGPAAGGAEKRPWRALADIPPFMTEAVILSEDRRFYSHWGLDPRSLARAMWINLRRGGLVQGGSTLTQQLVKNAFLSKERTLRRKIVEALLSFAMERRYSKNQILEMYLNQIYWGQNGAAGLFGIEDASRAYFGKPATDLTPPESALLVGIIPSPNAFHPRKFPERARLRRERVLGMLFKQGRITADEFRQWAQGPLALAPQTQTGVGDYYVTWVREALELTYPGALLDSQGYRVFTSMNEDDQRAAEKALSPASLALLPVAKSTQPLQAALVALEPETGHVRALVGGRKFPESPYNRATLALRQPGSAMKPLVLAAALESRNATLATVLEDKPLTLEQNGAPWSPQNYDGKFRGTTTVREAIVLSLNVPSIHLLEKVGAEPVLALARGLGVRSDLRPVPSLALGTSEITPLEMTAAYAAFANGGNAVAPIFIQLVTDAEGNVLEEHRPALSPAMSPETADLVTMTLRDVVERGTAVSARRLGFLAPAAGKTGTSQKYLDAWFVGYTPQLVAGVWVGFDQPASLGRASSALTVPLWVKFMQAASPQAGEFQIRSKLAEKSLDPASSLLARAGCSPQVREFFIPGTEPTEFCPLHPGGMKGLFRRLKNWVGDN